jgi:hypothetical protein
LVAELDVIQNELIRKTADGDWFDGRAPPRFRHVAILKNQSHAFPFDSLTKVVSLLTLIGLIQEV